MSNVNFVTRNFTEFSKYTVTDVVSIRCMSVGGDVLGSIELLDGEYLFIPRGRPLNSSQLREINEKVEELELERNLRAAGNDQ
jgi:hypothetical protein